MLQNTIDLFGQNMSHPINMNEEFHIQLPISSLEDLQLFEKQLEEERLKAQMVHYFVSSIFYAINII